MPGTVEITAKNFESTVAKPGIVLLDFWASWCAPCRAFGPIFEGAAQAHPDVVFGKVDTEAQPELAAAFEVQSIPTLMVFKDGLLVFAQPGMLPAKVLENLVTQAIALDMDKVRAELAQAKQAQQPRKAS